MPNLRACGANRDFLSRSLTSQALDDCFRVVRACTRAHTHVHMRTHVRCGGGVGMRSCSYRLDHRQDPRGRRGTWKGPVREAHGAASLPRRRLRQAGPLEPRGGTHPGGAISYRTRSGPSADSVSRADL